MLNENKVALFLGQLSIKDHQPLQRYNSLVKCCIASWKKFHPNIQVIHVTNDNLEEYLNLIGEEIEFYEHGGLMRYILAEKVMRAMGLEKMIVLGVDTIICGRFDEFLDDDTTDVLATLNYPCVESTAYWKTPVYEFQDASGNKIFDFLNLNSDVACFNNVDAFKKVNDLSVEHWSGFAEQGGLNELAVADKSYNVKVVDFPYHQSKVVYNCRSKGVFGTAMNNETTPQMHFYVKDGKLFTHDHKQIKVWHYAEGLADQNEYEFKALMDRWKFKLFNEATKKFFTEQCDCGDFFERPYDIQKDWFGN